MLFCCCLLLCGRSVVGFGVSVIIDLLLKLACFFAL